MTHGTVAAGVLVVTVAALIVSVRSETPAQCLDDDTREQVRAILLDGFALALKEHTKHVFEIWMKDDSEQPKRAIAGMREGITAYARSRNAALKWSPPLCPAKP